MRRLSGFVLVAVIALVTVAGALPVMADDSAPALLAVEGDPIGPEPMDRLQEGNPARELAGYEDPEVPFTWGAAWLLTFAGLMGLALMAGVYYLRVHLPSREAEEQH